MTEFNARNSYLNEKKPLECSISVQQGKKPVEKDIAAHAWHGSRRRWVGVQSQRSKRIAKVSNSQRLLVTLATWERTVQTFCCSWTTTYEEFLSTNEPFSGAIPLAEMVDFLVDLWHEEGLFD